MNLARHMVHYAYPRSLILGFKVIADSLNEGDLGADWQYVVPSIIPLGYGEIAVGIIYDANTLTLEVSDARPGGRTVTHAG